MPDTGEQIQEQALEIVTLLQEMTEGIEPEAVRRGHQCMVAIAVLARLGHPDMEHEERFMQLVNKTLIHYRKKFIRMMQDA